MSSGEVNHILQDFLSNKQLNPSGWNEVTLAIGGSNGNVDGTSGGYNGTAAINALVGSYDWTITYNTP